MALEWLRARAGCAGAIITVWSGVAFKYDCAAWVPLCVAAGACWLIEREERGE
jgi:hypothetical protein